MIMRNIYFFLFPICILGFDLSCGDKSRHIRVSDTNEFIARADENRRITCQQFFTGFNSSLGIYCAANGTKLCEIITIVSPKIHQPDQRFNNLIQDLEKELGGGPVQDRDRFVNECLSKK